MTHSQLTALLAHLDTDAVATFEDRAADDPAERGQAEFLALLDALGLEEVTAKDTDAVAGLLRLGAVGVEDAEAEGAVGVFRDSFSFPPRFQSFR